MSKIGTRKNLVQVIFTIVPLGMNLAQDIELDCCYAKPSTSYLSKNYTSNEPRTPF